MSTKKNHDHRGFTRVERVLSYTDKPVYLFLLGFTSYKTEKALYGMEVQVELYENIKSEKHLRKLIKKSQKMKGAYYF